MLIVKEITAKSILNKSKIYDYCVNPYTGCEMDCKYCYARLFMRRYSGHKEPWGKFVDVKINAPVILKKQLERAKRGTVWISSVCDPYQRVEERYRITRQCLQELVIKQFPVCVQTKSALILRDLDLFLQFEEIKAGFTITTDNERIARLFESQASSVKDRIDALQKLHQNGISTFVFLGPLLPGNPERLIEILHGTVDYIYIDKMNYSDTIKKFYHQNNLNHALEAPFFYEYKNRLIDALRKRDLKFEVLF
jgi:DNA repair photolyase